VPERGDDRRQEQDEQAERQPQDEDVGGLEGHPDDDGQRPRARRDQDERPRQGGVHAGTAPAGPAGPGPPARAASSRANSPSTTAASQPPRQVCWLLRHTSAYRSAGRSSSRRSAAASHGASRSGGSRSTSGWAPSSSPVPPTSVATTGTPWAIASITDTGTP